MKGVIKKASQVDPAVANWWAVVAIAFFIGCIVGWVGAAIRLKTVICTDPETFIAERQDAQPIAPAERLRLLSSPSRPLPACGMTDG